MYLEAPYAFYEIGLLLIKKKKKKDNLTTLGQVHHFSTSQTMLYLLNNIVPNMLGLIGGPQE
jgi:hypothetical protein